MAIKHKLKQQHNKTINSKAAFRQVLLTNIVRKTTHLQYVQTATISEDATNCDDKNKKQQKLGFKSVVIMAVNKS